MDELRDNAIAGSGIPVTEPQTILPNQKPEKFIDIPDAVITSFSTYMQVVLNMSEGTKHQSVEVKKNLENAKNMFRDAVKYKDDLWMQHTAASMREIIGFVNIDGEDFYKAHSSIPTYATDQTIKDQLDRIISVRSYLSDIVHFVQGNRFGIIQRLYPNDGYATMRKEKFFQDEETTFEKVCIDFVYTLNDIFVKYCVGVVPETPQTTV
ncbi:hypothetical protein A2880_03345 [Candidatus Peribacteria bacterium RIFCSPHIGHO2_01_FULL_49_38]|nr:MAG: hypothetical protein A2880_03345 [Candidatus Peribacteria bacterium RIFCSPHIGHO2_01_FULL_49_38]